MRKINFLFGVLAVAATGLLSSCDWSDDSGVSNPSVSQPVLDGNTLLVTTNVNATIEVGGQRQTGTNATFTVNGNKTVATISANGYLTQEVEVNFGENTMLSVNVQLVKASTNKVSQSAASNAPIENDGENRQATGVNASITVPANTTVTGSTDDFSIVAYAPAEAGNQSVNEGETVSLPVLALSCTPSGATFSNPVTLTASVKDAAGCEVVCVNGDETVEATVGSNSVSAEVTHFSIWEFVLKAQVTNIVESELIKTGSILLVSGDNIITYTQKYGFEVDANYNGLITNFLVNQFGKAGSVSKSAKFTSNKAGSANYTVKQAVKTYTFRSGTQTFIAKVYGAVTVQIESTTADTSGHSGGSGM